LADKDVFLCGPSSMIASLVEQLRELGVEERSIVTEEFNLV
jgi:predicted ferric reductase